LLVKPTSSTSKTKAELGGITDPNPRGPEIRGVRAKWTIYGQIIHTISQIRRDGESALFADAHPDETLVPTSDNLSNTD
jgi:hypothetical protein